VINAPWAFLELFIVKIITVRLDNICVKPVLEITDPVNTAKTDCRAEMYGVNVVVNVSVKE
jgi:hypothetical protein